MAIPVDLLADYSYDDCPNYFTVFGGLSVLFVESVSEVFAPVNQCSNYIVLRWTALESGPNEMSLMGLGRVPEALRSLSMKSLYFPGKLSMECWWQ